MTITRAERATPSGSGAGAAWPQVDLLPPEVRIGRRLKATKRMLAIGVVGVVCVTAAGVVAAFADAANAGGQLVEAQKATAGLMAEQAKYAEVPQVLGKIAVVEADRQAGMSTEILWQPYLEALRAVTPPNVSYRTMSVIAQTPMAAGPTSANILAAPSIGQITFAARATTLPDISAWMDAIEQVPGLSDPWFDSAVLTDEDGNVFYQISASVSILDSALESRFVPEEGK